MGYSPAPRHPKEADLTLNEYLRVKKHHAYRGKLVVVPEEWGMSSLTYHKSLSRESTSLDLLGHPITLLLGIGALASTSFIAPPTLGRVALAGALLCLIFSLPQLFYSVLVHFTSVEDDEIHPRDYAPEVLARLDPAAVIDLSRLGTIGKLLSAVADEHQAEAYGMAKRFVAALPALNGHTLTLFLAQACFEDCRRLLVLTQSYPKTVKLRGELATMMTLAGEPEEKHDEPVPSAKKPSLRELWDGARAAHERVAGAWGAIVTDPLSAIDHSSLLDVTQARTAAFVEAYGELQDFTAIHGEGYDPAEAKEYLSLVRRADAAWSEAYRYSKQVGARWLSPKDQKTMARVGKLLALAADESGSPAERAVAAQQAAKLLQAFTALTLPEQAAQVLGSYARLALPPAKRRGVVYDSQAHEPLGKIVDLQA